MVHLFNSLSYDQNCTYHGGESLDILTCIGAERVRKLIVISSMLDEFSYGEVQLLCGFCIKPLYVSGFNYTVFFPYNLNQSMKYWLKTV